MNDMISQLCSAANKQGFFLSEVKEKHVFVVEGLELQNV